VRTFIKTRNPAGLWQDFLFQFIRGGKFPLLHFAAANPLLILSCPCEGWKTSHEDIVFCNFLNFTPVFLRPVLRLNAARLKNSY